MRSLPNQIHQKLEKPPTPPPTKKLLKLCSVPVTTGPKSCVINEKTFAFSQEIDEMILRKVIK